jgi:uncharacterized protein YjbI with pentapeptide repeats
VLSTLFVRLWRSHRPGLLAALAVAAIAYAVLLIWPISDLIAAHDVGTIAAPTRAMQLETARQDARTLLLTMSAGFFAAGALFFTALNFTLSRRTTELTEQGQVTDRYTKAIEQLGSDKIDIRIGGIYALERIARDSARDHPTVVEVLTAFIREHSHEPWPLPQAASPGQPTAASERATRPDVQAAITVVGRRIVGRDGDSQVDLIGADLTAANLRSVNLANANLRGATLAGAYVGHANLAGATFSGADLQKTDFTAADLTGASLTGANLKDAFLPGAHLADAHLQRADLTGATLTVADLTTAKLFKAKLIRAKLIETKLAGALLRGADFTEANLTDADLSGADLSEADLPRAVLDRANLDDTDLTGTWFPAEAAVPTGWACPPGSGRLSRMDPMPDENRQDPTP